MGAVLVAAAELEVDVELILKVVVNGVVLEVLAILDVFEAIELEVLGTAEVRLLDVLLMIATVEASTAGVVVLTEAVDAGVSVEFCAMLDVLFVKTPPVVALGAIPVEPAVPVRVCDVEF